MPLSLSILASGSSGNCTILRNHHSTMLIDCGIGPRAAAARMKPLGLTIADISAICLTHLDYDHFKPTWVNEIIRRKIFLYCHQSRVDDLTQRLNNLPLARLIRPFDVQPFSPIQGMCCGAINLPHDEQGSHGFVIEGANSRIGYATDLGRVHAELIERFSGLDILAIESNYDPQMQQDSQRPWFLKRRIMGGRGHLSNQQAFQAVQKILDRTAQSGASLPRHIVLLHCSRQCNCPRLLKDLFAGDLRIAPRLVLAEQDRPTQWLTTGPRDVFDGEQLHLQWNANESNGPYQALQAAPGKSADHAPLALPARHR